MRWGLTATASPYGGIVFALLATHGVHILAAVLYWSFVCVLWVAIVAVVYLA